MIGFKDTMVWRSAGFVTFTTFFIMISGPIAIHSSYTSPLSKRSWRTVVTNPFVPSLPSSVATYTFSQNSRNLSAHKTYSLLLPPMITSTFVPFSANLRSCGYKGAAPTPPATPMTLFSFFSRAAGTPRGPTKSATYSPSFFWLNRVVEYPNTW